MSQTLIKWLLAAALAISAAGCSSSSSDSTNNDDDDGDGDTGDTVSESPASAGDLRFNEVMADPVILIESQGEWFEIRNPTGTRFNLRDCVFSDASTNNFSVTTDLEIDAGELRTFAISATPGFTPDFNYNGSGLTLNNNGDTLILTCNGITIDTRNYVAAAVASGRSSSASANGNGKWCFDLGNVYNGDRGSPGLANVNCP